MYGLFFLLEFKTIDRATNSFPVPFSPYINTLAFVDAAWDIANFTFFIAMRIELSQVRFTIGSFTIPIVKRFFLKRNFLNKKKVHFTKGIVKNLQ